MPWAASGAASSANTGGSGARRVGTRSASEHAGDLGAVAASTADPDEHGSRRWYQRPKRLGALVAVLLLALVWLGDHETPPDSAPNSSQGVVVSGQEDTEGDSTRDEAQAEARRRRVEAREARQRRERRAEVRAAEKRRRLRAARAARKRAAARRERREKRQAQAAALAAQREAEAQAAEEAAAATGGGGGECEAGYDPCVPSYPPDLDCADTGPVSVSGSDPHGLDGDNDGVACGGD